LIELLVVIAIIAILVAMLSFYGNATNVLFCPSAPDKGAVGLGANPPGTSDSAWHWTIFGRCTGIAAGLRPLCARRNGSVCR